MVKIGLWQYYYSINVYSTVLCSDAFMEDAFNFSKSDGSALKLTRTFSSILQSLLIIIDVVVVAYHPSNHIYQKITCHN